MTKLKLQAYLEENQITKYAFATVLGKKPPAVRPYFRKGYDPKLSTLGKWAKALRCEISDLYVEAKHKGRQRRKRRSM
ncbi:MAG: helix-turn-helix transcriptional regulator [Bdellovibrionaceae bacterium]|nr:helix-turn-helix transcriptional regulator [Pseudobdellovibrionaceae bacterium]